MQVTIKPKQAIPQIAYKRLKKLKIVRRLKTEAEKAEDFLEKPWYRQIVTKEFARALPGATKKVLGTIKGAPLGAAKSVGRATLNQLEKAFTYEQDKRHSKWLTEEEKQKRTEILKRLKKALEEWKKNNPGKPIPKEFRDL